MVCGVQGLKGLSFEGFGFGALVLAQASRKSTRLMQAGPTQDPGTRIQPEHVYTRGMFTACLKGL